MLAIYIYVAMYDTGLSDWMYTVVCRSRLRSTISYNCSSICTANKYFARTFLRPNKIALAAKYAALTTSPWQRNLSAEEPSKSAFILFPTYTPRTSD